MENETDNILIIFSLALILAGGFVTFVSLILGILECIKKNEELKKIMKKGVSSSIEPAKSTTPSEIAVGVTDTVIQIEQGHKTQISDV